MHSLGNDIKKLTSKYDEAGIEICPDFKIRFVFLLLIFIRLSKGLDNLKRNHKNIRIEIDSTIKIKSVGTGYARYLITGLHNNSDINNKTVGILYGSTNYQGLKYIPIFTAGSYFSFINGTVGEALQFSSNTIQTDITFTPLGYNEVGLIIE